MALKIVGGLTAAGIGGYFFYRVIQWLDTVMYLKPPCRHYHTVNRFFDIHMGDRWYVRGTAECCDCDWKRTFAIPMPDSLDLDQIDKSAYYDEVRDGKHKR